jgi:hypothetical protein
MSVCMNEMAKLDGKIYVKLKKNRGSKHIAIITADVF